MNAHAQLTLQPLQALVKQRSGLQFEGADADKLAQAVAQRCTALGLDTPAYLPYVAGHEAEFQELVNLLTINETYFFREPEQIDLLVNRLVPRLLAHCDGSRPVRILSAGCSTGEEPYSLAMALMHKYGDNTARWFTLMGGDIDSQALAKARRGHYSDFSFRGVDEALRQRYFTPSSLGRGWQVRPEVQEAVRFYPLNLLSTPMPEALHDCDIILFRNVSIYFDTPTRRQIQHHLAQLLRPDGVLLIGTAETLANDLGVLPLVEEAGLFYFVKGQPASVPPRAQGPSPAPFAARALGSVPPVSPAPRPTAPAQPPQPLQVPADWHQASPSASSTTDSLLQQAEQAVRGKHFEAAASLLERALAQAAAGSAQQTQARLLQAYVWLERKDFAAARALAEQVLQADAWSVDACVLLGLAAKWDGQPAEAARYFRQAIYAHHACWPAHYFLADVLRAEGALEQARRSWRVVLQSLPETETGSAADGAAEHGIRYLPLVLPVQDIRFLCQRHLAQTAAQAG